MSARVALVSSERGLRVDPDLPIARTALVEAGLAVDLVRWDDPSAAWDAYDLAVWDPVDAGQLPDAAEWVVKPSISAGSRDTARWSASDEALDHVAQLTAAGRTAMVQPYVDSVDDAGETAMVFLGGRFSHAVRKGPLLGRGEGVRQDRDSRADLRPAVATPEQRAVAQAVFDAVPQLVPGAPPVLYARIDLLADAAGSPVLLELELAEPSLFLPQALEGPASLVRAVEAELQA